MFHLVEMFLFLVVGCFCDNGNLGCYFAVSKLLFMRRTPSSHKWVGQKVCVNLVHVRMLRRVLVFHPVEVLVFLVG